MAAQRSQIVPKTSYSFNVASGATTLTLGPRAIDSQDWRSGVLLVNLFSATGPSTNNITIGVYNAMITPENPSTVFTSSTALASTTFNSSTATPVELVIPFSGGASGIASMVVVQLTAASGIAGTTACTVSVELEGREG
jgi:hypothetical protein